MNLLLPLCTTVMFFHRSFELREVLWAIFGYTGIGIFGTRFLVQWYHSEKHKESRIPPIFWWQSLAGTFVLLIYFVHKREWVGVSGYILNVIPYTRNLVLVHRKQQRDAQSHQRGPETAVTK